MKVLAIVGSFRKQGNTDILVEKALQGAREIGAETEKIFVDDLKIGSCQGCLECRKEGICKLEDDLMPLVKKIDESDGVIFSSPIYGNYMTGQLKVLLDRLMGVINKTTYTAAGRQSFSRLELKERNVLIILTAGAPNEDCGDTTLKLMTRMFDSFTNGGSLNKLIATHITSAGEVAFGLDELIRMARIRGSKTPEETALESKSRNDAFLERAYEEGRCLVLSPENNQG